MNVFIEKIISKDKSTKDTILKGIIVTIAIILCIVTIFVTTSESLKYFRFLIIALIVYLAYILISSLNVEYEYSITSEYIDIDKLMSQRKRKKVIRIDMSSIAIIAPITYPDHMTIKKSDMQKVIYAVGNMQNDDIYYIIAKVDDKLCLVYIESDERILEALKTYAKSKVKD